MQLSRSMKLIVALLLLAGTVAYLLLLELAINAGRVHRGVSVAGFPVGGLNPPEAEEALRERGEQLESTPLVFTSAALDCRFTPADLGWGPQPADTMKTAMDVGREGGLASAIGDRVRAWFGGIDIDWAGKPDPARVGRELNRCEEQAEALGIEIDRARLRYLIKRTIAAWPREPMAIPVRA